MPECPICHEQFLTDDPFDGIPETDLFHHQRSTDHWSDAQRRQFKANEDAAAGRGAWERSLDD